MSTLKWAKDENGGIWTSPELSKKYRIVTVPPKHGKQMITGKTFTFNHKIGAEGVTLEEIEELTKFVRQIDISNVLMYGSTNIKTKIRPEGGLRYELAWSDELTEEKERVEKEMAKVKKRTSKLHAFQEEAIRLIDNALNDHEWDTGRVPPPRNDWYLTQRNLKFLQSIKSSGGWMTTKQALAVATTLERSGLVVDYLYTLIDEYENKITINPEYEAKFMEDKEMKKQFKDLKEEINALSTFIRGENDVTRASLAQAHKKLNDLIETKEPEQDWTVKLAHRLGKRYLDKRINTLQMKSSELIGCISSPVAIIKAHLRSETLPELLQATWGIENTYVKFRDLKPVLEDYMMLKEYYENHYEGPKPLTRWQKVKAKVKNTTLRAGYAAIGAASAASYLLF